MTDLKKEKEKLVRIQAEIKKLNTAYKNLGRNQKNICKKLIENAAFMAVSLEDLQDIINRDGYTSEYKNGENQYGTKRSPDVDTYLAMSKNYTTITKQLSDLLLKYPQKEESDGLDEFCQE